MFGSSTSPPFPAWRSDENVHDTRADYSRPSLDNLAYFRVRILGALYAAERTLRAIAEHDVRLIEKDAIRIDLMYLQRVFSRSAAVGSLPFLDPWPKSDTCIIHAIYPSVISSINSKVALVKFNVSP